MTIPLELVADPPTHRNFLKLAQFVLDTGGQSVGIRFGLATLTFPGGSALSDIDTVSHGLGTTPVAAFLTAVHNDVFAGILTVGATTFTMQGQTVDGSSPASSSPVNYYWLAIG